MKRIISAGTDGAMPAKPDPVRPSAMPFAWLEFLDNLWDARSEFRYVERGKMASMGMWGGVADLTKSEITPVGGTLTGVTAFASWRGAYLSKQVSVQNMILIPMFWFKTGCLGGIYRASKNCIVTFKTTFTRTPAGRNPRRPSTGTGPSSPCRPSAITWAAPPIPQP